MLRPRRPAYRLDLARSGDFVAQTNFVQCVGASMQMMLNIVGARDDRSAQTQLRLQALARNLSGPTREGFDRKGASVRGWSAGLNQLGAGPVSPRRGDDAGGGAPSGGRLDPTDREARRAARLGRPARLGDERLRGDGRPGRDVRLPGDAAIVLDPLYPYGSGRWGASPRPREAITPSTLGKQFVPRRRGTWAGAVTGTVGTATMNALAGKYVIVMPFEPIVLVRHRAVAV